MNDRPCNWVYAVVLDRSRKDGGELPVVRVGRLPGVDDPGRLLRKCRFRGKKKLLPDSAVPYGPDGCRSQLEVGLAIERELIGKLRLQGYIVTNRPPKTDCHVYVIELDRSVRTHRDVKRNNPHADQFKACLYVGQTRRSPEERFQEHSTGSGLKKGGRHLLGKCLRLRPDLYEVFNPMPLLESLVLERELAEDLRREGYTVLGGH